jgi:hypothetical protein
MAKQLTTAVVREWVDLAKGSFAFRDICFEIGIQSTESKKHLRVILFRLEQEGIISNLGSGRYRKLDSELKPMDWRNADPGNTVDLKYPFGLEKYCLIYPKNVIIVAGQKQEGKTTWLYDFIKLNMGKFKIDLFNSETGVEQMKDRFNDLGLTDAPGIENLSVYERYDNFADVIQPNHISVIDYLDMNSEFYLVGTEIDAIFRKTNSIVLIGMQIPPPSTTLVKGVKKVIERDYAYGGGVTAKRAFIYISLGNRKLKIKHAKKPAQPNVNPANMQWSYNFNEHGQFCDIRRSYGESQSEF